MLFSGCFFFLVFIFLMYVGYKLGTQNSHPIPIIKAEDEFVRVLPSDPGGLHLEHQDKEIYNVIATDAMPERNKANVESPEQLQTIASTKEDKSSRNDISKTPSAERTSNSHEKIPPQPGIINFEDFVAVEVVNPDHNMSENIHVTDEKISTPPPKDSPDMAISGLNTDDSAVSSPEIPARKKFEHEIPSSQRDEVISEKDTESFKAVAPARKQDSKNSEILKAWKVQIAALATESDAQKRWKELLRISPEVLDKLSMHMQKASVNGRTWYRVRVIPETGTKKDALNICHNLRLIGQDCLIVPPNK